MKGDLVVVAFPFSGMKGTKRRPAIVVAKLKGDDIIVCNITSSRFDRYSISISNDDLEQGILKSDSQIRPNILFTMENDDIDYKIGYLNESKIKEVENRLVKIFTKT